ncbi:hypothetical protein GCM10023228_00170 [Brevibacillus fulvus]
MLLSQALLHNVQIETKFQPKPLLVDCDQNQIKQVFINLLKNAIESMPNGGLVVIATESDDQEVVIQFRDRGNGISPETLAKLGEPFYTTKEAGTGLGLMISFRIVENHKGRIDVASKVGKGTTMKVRLPLAAGEQQKKARRSQ